MLTRSVMAKSFTNAQSAANKEELAIAGGCGLATLADFTLAAPEASFGYTEVRFGFMPAVVSVFLLRQIGEKRARDLLLTGRIIGAEEAYRLGWSAKSFRKRNARRSGARSSARRKTCLCTCASRAGLRYTARSFGGGNNAPVETQRYSVRAHRSRWRHGG
ncbi:MAG: enoyl-CoA hydratase/isomerase family protein [Acidobacteriia bacterium]|nr:enoyl-CoA hydratase/isomerase family protein [Terriglobia bacterium]